MKTKAEKAARQKVYNAKPEVKASVKEYNKENKEKRATQQKAYNGGHQEEIDACNRDYYQENKERLDAKHKVYNQLPEGRFTVYKSSAKRCDRSFELTLADHFTPGAPNTYWQKPCTYCGDKIDTIGLDRIDNDKGYAVDNVVSCCFDCNGTRSDRWTFEEMRDTIGPALAKVKEMRKNLISQ